MTGFQMVAAATKLKMSSNDGEVEVPPGGRTPESSSDSETGPPDKAAKEMEVTAQEMDIIDDLLEELMAEDDGETDVPEDDISPPTSPQEEEEEEEEEGNEAEEEEEEKSSDDEVEVIFDGTVNMGSTHLTPPPRDKYMRTETSTVSLPSLRPRSSLRSVPLVQAPPTKMPCHYRRPPRRRGPPRGPTPPPRRRGPPRGPTPPPRPETPTVPLSHSEPIPPKTEYVKCAQCGKRMKKAAWRPHKRRHAKVFPFRCQVCGMSWECKKALDNHVVTHTREKRFTCEICNRSFGHQSTVRSHKMRDHADIFGARGLNAPVFIGHSY